jgi:hypothetical protein
MKKGVQYAIESNCGFDHVQLIWETHASNITRLSFKRTNGSKIELTAILNVLFLPYPIVAPYFLGIHIF